MNETQADPNLARLHLERGREWIERAEAVETPLATEGLPLADPSMALVAIPFGDTGVDKSQD